MKTISKTGKTMKVKAVEITVNRAEGPNESCGQRTFKGDDCWKRSQAQISTWRETAPKELGYDKTDFKITFADGVDTYEGCIDLKHPDHPNPETSNLADHVAQHVLFMMGQWKPSHMKQTAYDEYMGHIEHEDPESKANHRRFWLTYEIPSPWSKSAAAFGCETVACRV